MNRADLEAMAQREQQRQQAFGCRILCCASTPCLSSGGQAVYDAINAVISEGGWDAEVQAVATGCMGPCSHGPMVTVQRPDEEDVVYERVTPDVARTLVAAHAGKADAVVPAEHVMPASAPFFAKQQKVVLANSGLIDPEKLEDYVARGGYRALAYALREMTPEEVCGDHRQRAARAGRRRLSPPG
jgi:bidirectional [NiFe] hydrogenase diaphorase subunit